MQDLQNSKTTFNFIRFIWMVIITLFLCWGWFSWADAASVRGTHGDQCAAFAEISDYAYWECHGATCLADCNTINPDAPDYCANVCAGVR